MIRENKRTLTILLFCLVAFSSPLWAQGFQLGGMYEEISGVNVYSLDARLIKSPWIFEASASCAYASLLKPEIEIGDESKTYDFDLAGGIYLGEVGAYYIWGKADNIDVYSGLRLGCGIFHGYLEAEKEKGTFDSSLLSAKLVLLEGDFHLPSIPKLAITSGLGLRYLHFNKMTIDDSTSDDDSTITPHLSLLTISPDIGLRYSL